MTFRRGRRCTGTSRPGPTTVSPTASTTRCGRRCAMPPGVTRWHRAGIVDAQSVKGADTVGAHSRGYDAGKKVNGRKRHIVVDTLGLLIVVLVTRPACRTATAGAASSTARGWRCRRSRWSGPTVATRASWLPGSPGTAGLCLRSCGNPRGSALSRSAAPLGGGTNPVLAGALATTRPRLRTPAHPFRSHGQMGHDRPHGTTPGAPARTTALATGPCPVNPFPNTF